MSSAAGQHDNYGEKVLSELDDVMDPMQSPAGHDLSARHLQERVEREQHALKLVHGQAG